jgi:hypothetical protein
MRLRTQHSPISRFACRSVLSGALVCRVYDLVLVELSRPRHHVAVARGGSVVSVARVGAVVGARGRVKIEGAIEAGAGRHGRRRRILRHNLKKKEEEWVIKINEFS